MSVHELRRKDVLTNEEALAVALRTKWKHVMIIGVDENDEVALLCGQLKAKDALWLAEILRIEAMK